MPYDSMPIRISPGGTRREWATRAAAWGPGPDRFVIRPIVFDKIECAGITPPAAEPAIPPVGLGVNNQSYIRTSLIRSRSFPSASSLRQHQECKSGGVAHEARQAPHLSGWKANCTRIRLRRRVGPSDFVRDPLAFFLAGSVLIDAIFPSFHHGRPANRPIGQRFDKEENSRAERKDQPLRGNIRRIGRT